MKRIFWILFILISFYFIPNTVCGQRPPVKAGFTESPSIGCELPRTVFFTDLSENPDIWLWKFGDGSTSTSKNPIHSYTSAGSFSVSLWVQDTINGDYDEITRVITIGVTTVDFNASRTFGCGPLTSNFTDLSSINGAGSIVSWLWNFGDGTTSTEQNPSHTYNTRGTYTVALTTTTSLGCTNTRTKTNYIQVIGPNVQFTASNSGNNYTFTNATISGSPITSRLWNFGDGVTSNLQNPTHTYTTSGVFDVSLTITDLDGCSRTLTKTNFVNTISGAFNVSQAIFTGDHERFSVADLATLPSSLAFDPEGTKMFVLDADNGFINEYNLSSAYDVSTAVYAGDAERFSVAAQELSASSIAFSTNGQKMFVMGFGGATINEYHLATAFDISTAVYAGNSERFSVAAQETHPTSLTFNQEGTRMYVTGVDNDGVHQYILSTAFDVSTAVYQTTLSVSAQDESPQSIAFVGNGFKLLLMGSAGDNINLYNLTTAFNISTASYAGDAERLSVAGQEDQPTSFAFNTAGTQLYVLGLSGNINIYSLASPVITGAAANQAINDTSSISLFTTITVQDPNGDNVSATITIDDNTKGILTGAGLSGTGPYTLASTDAASLQAGLRALIFSPTENRTATSETTTITLEVSDGSFSDIDNITTVVSSAVAPTVIISSTATDPINGAFTATFTFSEEVTGFEIGDITVGNGTVSDFVSTSASVYTALITPTNDGTVSVDVAGDLAQDAGGMGNTAAIQFSIMADLTVPSLAITSVATDLTNTAFTAIFTFSENVSGFELGDIEVGNGTASDFTAISASEYTALITPAADGTVTIDVAADVAEDEATNGNTAATRFSIEADLTAPSLAITSAATDLTNAAFTAVFTFSENVSGFEVGDISVGNGMASDFTTNSASEYTALITPAADGTVTIDVATDVAEDEATNGNTAATRFSIEADLTAPSLAITSAATDPTNVAFTAVFTFSENVSGFEVGDISVGNGMASDFTTNSASEYTALITPAADGTVTIDVAANVAEDAATNGNTAATRFSIEADLTAPSLAITSAAIDPTNVAFTAVFTFSENVSGFEVGDISVGNGMASDFTTNSASEYTALITPAADGTVTIDVAANVAEDAATNGNTAATRFSIDYDGSVTQVICQDITVQLDANGLANIEASQIDNGSSDYYGITNMTLDITTFDCSNIGDNEVTLTVTDVNGNTGTCVAVVTVEDITAPTVIVRDVTLPLDANGQAAITVDDIDNGSSDNCGIASRALDVSGFDNPTTTSATVTLTVTDLSGNSASSTATVTFGKVSQTILFNPLPDKKVGADPVILQATGGESGLPITFSIITEPSSGVASLADGTIIIEGQGMVIVTANQAGNDIFEPAPSVSQTFEIQSNELFLPTLFSPNNDQVNDRFIIRGGGNIATIELRIFDRDHNLVFSSNSMTELFQTGWDGAGQPPGVYIWMVKGSAIDGTPVLINGKNTGFIRLVR